MSARSTPAHVAAGEAFLSDGLWHQVEDLKRAIEAAIPSPVAVRQYERERKWSSKRGPDAGLSELPIDRQVAAGRRRIAVRTLHNKIRGTWERDGDYVRIRPVNNDKGTSNGR